MKKPEPNHDEISIALTTLQNVCKSNGVSLAGFIWNSTTTIYNFGCKEASDITLYEKLVRWADSRRAVGAVTNVKRFPVN